MEQLQLFDIEPIQIRAFDRKNKALYKKLKKVHVSNSKTLLDELQPEVKKVPLIVCKRPKTVKMIPYNWTKEQREAYIKAHYDENGHFIMQPAGDFDVFGGMANRQ